MKHVFRFFGTPDNHHNHTSLVWSITGEEHTHLKKILRLQVGDHVEVTDGCGAWGEGVITVIDNHMTTINLDKIHCEKRVTPSLTIAIAFLKPGSIDEVLPGLIELGADQILLFRQEHSPKHQAKDKVMQRWRRIAGQAVKQSKRCFIPEIKEFDSLALVLKEYAVPHSPVFCFDYGAQISIWTYLDGNLVSKAGVQPNHLLAIIGSEGGLSGQELELARHSGARMVSLSGGVLRATTATLAAMTCLSGIQRKYSGT